MTSQKLSHHLGADGILALDARIMEARKRPDGSLRQVYGAEYESIEAQFRQSLAVRRSSQR